MVRSPLSRERGGVMGQVWDFQIETMQSWVPLHGKDLYRMDGPAVETILALHQAWQALQMKCMWLDGMEQDRDRYLNKTIELEQRLATLEAEKQALKEQWTKTNAEYERVSRELAKRIPTAKSFDVNF